MKLNQLELQSLAMAELDTYKLEDLDINSDLALKCIEEEIQEELDDLASDETKKARHKHFKIPGISESHYSEQKVQLTDDRFVIHGIRHINGDRNLPFINVKANFEISDKKS